VCGICGFVSRQKISIDELHEMNDAMAHRGPDDRGAFILPLKDGYSMGLAQRRLSIVDLSEHGHQPMHSFDERVTIVFNGEIYNFLELRKELTGYPFKSSSDTEVIIAAYYKWGVDFINRLNGMFALAIHDKKAEALYLFRDRVGKKPLYYQVEDGNFYFASELKPLMKRPRFKKDIRKDVLSRYLFHQYICHPDSIFEGVRMLPPGSFIHLNLGIQPPFSPKINKYWDVKDAYHEMRKAPVTNYGQGITELTEILKKAVAKRLIADVPIGTFLSGGYDSSLVTALAVQISETPVKTFSIGFDDESHNEAKYAKAVAKYLGTDHTETYITEDEMFALVDSIPHFYDEPFADASQIPSMLVSELAVKDIKVALSGDGGDELFCGYNIYQKVKQAQLLDFTGGIVHGFANLPLINKLEIERRLPFNVRVISANRDPDKKVQFGAGSYVHMAEKMVDCETGQDVIYPFERRYEVKNWQLRRMLLDIETYMCADILQKVDRASMKYGLEARCPILDKDVIEYSFRLPHQFKYQSGNKKRILKDIAYKYIPRELLNRPKVGFTVPLDKWMRGSLRSQLTDMVNKDYLRNQGLFNADYIINLVNDYLIKGDGGPASGANYSRLVWSFFTFQKWYNYYID